MTTEMRAAPGRAGRGTRARSRPRSHAAHRAAVTATWIRAVKVNEQTRKRRLAALLVLFPESYCLEREGCRHGVDVRHPIPPLAAEIESAIGARITRLDLKGRQNRSLRSGCGPVKRSDAGPVRI